MPAAGFQQVVPHVVDVCDRLLFFSFIELVFVAALGDLPCPAFCVFKVHCCHA